MKKSILLMSLLFSGAAFANDSCYEIKPGGHTEELDSPSISVHGSGEIYANGNMQAQIRVDYKALEGFSLTGITLCDYFEMEPMDKGGKWVVEEVDNGYLHKILSSQSSADEGSNDEPPSANDWRPFSDTRYLRTSGNDPVSADVCVVVTGTQSDEKVIAKTSCFGDSLSSIHVAAQRPDPVEFELKSKQIRDEKYHLAKVYELHSVDENIQISDIKYRTGAVEATDPILRVIGNSAFNVLRDYQGDDTSTWVGVWAYDSSKVKKIEMINEKSKTVGSFTLPTITPPSSPSLITSFFLFQIHRGYYMIADNLCEKTYDGDNLCIDYGGNYSFPNGVSDRLTNDFTITDFYGTVHSLSAEFGNGNDADDLFVY